MTIPLHLVTLEPYIKAFNPTVKQCSVVVGDGKGTRDGSKAQFSQPTGICFDYGTLFTVDTSTGTLRMTSSVTSLTDYLKHLHLFGETFGLHTKTSTSVIVEIPQAIQRLEQVYAFDKKYVDAVMSLIGTTALTQGPQGTVSSVVMEDERRILKSLRDIKELLDRFNPSLKTKFSMKSLLTLVVENTFSEMSSGATDMPLQLEFDYRFSRAIKERLKRQCFTPFAYFTAPKPYYPQVFTSTYYNDLPKLRPPKPHKLSEKQVSEMRNWRECMVRVSPKNNAKHDNKGQSRNSAHKFVCSWFSDCTAPRLHCAKWSSSSPSVTSGKQRDYLQTKPDCLGLKLIPVILVNCS